VVFFSVLQCVAVCVVVSDSCHGVLEAAVCCSVLQCVAVCCSVLQCVLRCAAVYCSVLQCVAVCCGALQCVAVSHSCHKLPMNCTSATVLANLNQQTIWINSPMLIHPRAVKLLNKWLLANLLMYNYWRIYWASWRLASMGWLRLVGSFKLYVSFAKEPYKRDHILQKRPVILRSLLIVATP